MVYVLMSLMLKLKYEREKNKMFPELIARNIEYGRMKVNIRAREV